MEKNMKPFRPMLAAQVENVDTLKFPLLASPKLDGIRAIIKDGVVFSRSMKPIPNKRIQEIFGLAELEGFDGELILGPPNAEDAYNKSMNVMAFNPTDPDYFDKNIKFYVFDIFDPTLDYQGRCIKLMGAISDLSNFGDSGFSGFSGSLGFPESIGDLKNPEVPGNPKDFRDPKNPRNPDNSGFSGDLKNPDNSGDPKNPEDPDNTRNPRNIGDFIIPVMSKLVWNQDRLLEFETEVLKNGFEGVMLRCPKGLYKQGRSTLKQQWLLKLKRFEDSEAEIIGYELFQKSVSGFKISETGYRTTSGKKGDKEAQELLGNLKVRDLTTKVEFEIGSGFTGDMRKSLWESRDAMIGKIVKYKHFNVGAIDKPRFPVFLGFRDPLDLVNY